MRCYQSSLIAFLAVRQVQVPQNKLFLFKPYHMKNLINNITKTFDGLVNTLFKANDTDLNKIPFENSWSIGQVAEHIILCGNGIPDSKTEISTRQKDEKVPVLKDIFLNMDEKSKADPALTPHGVTHKQEDLVNQIKAVKEKLCLIAEEKDLNDICLDMEFPTLGLLTRYEWLSFICFHTQRHTRQIENIIKHLKIDRSF